ncbi:MAG: hypothetical protein WC135_06070 [Bacteroidales bacterium]
MIEYKEVSYDEYVELAGKGTVYFYNDFEDIVYKRVKGEDGITRFFAKLRGLGEPEFEVFKEESDCLMDAIMQPQIISKEDYDRA